MDKNFFGADCFKMIFLHVVHEKKIANFHFAMEETAHEQIKLTTTSRMFQLVKSKRKLSPFFTQLITRPLNLDKKTYITQMIVL